MQSITQNYSRVYYCACSTAYIYIIMMYVFNGVFGLTCRWISDNIFSYRMFVLWRCNNDRYSYLDIPVNVFVFIWIWATERSPMTWCCWLVLIWIQFNYCIISCACTCTWWVVSIFCSLLTEDKPHQSETQAEPPRMIRCDKCDFRCADQKEQIGRASCRERV